MEIFDFFDNIHKLSKDAKASLERLIAEKSYPKNSKIQELGSRCRTIYFVKNGCARIYYLKDGNDITEHFAFENDLIIT